MGSNSVEEAAQRVGRSPSAEFEVHRGTEEETVHATPEKVSYGAASTRFGPYTIVVSPMVVFEFNKFHAGLPPWRSVESFTLHGKETATFETAEHRETNLTGNLKTVHMTARNIEFEDDGSGHKVEGVVT